jgi:hypothetical protein
MWKLKIEFRFFPTMAPTASAATAKSLKAHCTQVEGYKPPPGPGEHTDTKIDAMAPPLRQLRPRIHSSSRACSGRGGRGGIRGGRTTHDGALLSLGESLAQLQKKRDAATKRAADMDAFYDDLGSDDNDDIMEEMMDIMSDTEDEEEDKPVTTTKRENTRTGTAHSATMTTAP